MKRNFLVIWFAIYFTVSHLHGQLYVAAPSGLSLREGPSSNSKRIELLPYGTEINDFVQSYDHSDVIDGHSGYWYSVSKNGKQGFIFSGYTIPYAVPRQGELNLENYLSRAFNNPICLDSLTQNGDDGSGYAALYTNLYQNGVIYTHATGYEWHESSLINLDISLSQAYLYACLIDRTFQCIYKTITTADNQLKLTFPASGTTQYNDYHIHYNGTEVLIDTEHYFIKIFYLHGRAAITWGGGV